jgi:hypothetical protein
MAITYHKEVAIYCDSGSEDYFCWHEDLVVLKWWESSQVALRQFKTDGWVIGAKDICPFCDKGVKKPE